MKFFSVVKNFLFDFQLPKLCKGLEYFWVLAKLFALAAQSTHNNSIEIVGTLSVDL